MKTINVICVEKMVVPMFMETITFRFLDQSCDRFINEHEYIPSKIEGEILRSKIVTLRKYQGKRPHDEQYCGKDKESILLLDSISQINVDYNRLYHEHTKLIETFKCKGIKKLILCLKILFGI